MTLLCVYVLCITDFVLMVPFYGVSADQPTGLPVWEGTVHEVLCPPFPLPRLRHHVPREEGEDSGRRRAKGRKESRGVRGIKGRKGGRGVAGRERLGNRSTLFCVLFCRRLL